MRLFDCLILAILHSKKAITADSCPFTFKRVAKPKVTLAPRRLEPNLAGPADRSYPQHYCAPDLFITRPCPFFF